jgi:hypothetical protein
MYEIANEVEIDGTVEQVRQVLSGFDNFDAWNPVIRNVAGTLTVGQNVVISVAAPTGLRDWNVAVVRVDPGREFAWTFFERHPWLYRGEHTFRSSPSTPTGPATSTARPSTASWFPPEEGNSERRPRPAWSPWAKR